MALTTAQLEALTAEVARVLRPGGLLVYTARHTGDPDAGAGTEHGDGMYESGGFIVHFFDRALVERLARGLRAAGGRGARGGRAAAPAVQGDDAEARRRSERPAGES